MSDAREPAICSFTGITHISPEKIQLFVTAKEGEI